MKHAFLVAVAVGLAVVPAAHARLRSAAWGTDPAAPVYVGQAYDLTLTLETDADEEVPTFTIDQVPAPVRDSGARNPDAQEHTVRDGVRRTVFRWHVAEDSPRLVAIPLTRVVADVMTVRQFGFMRSAQTTRQGVGARLDRGGEHTRATAAILALEGERLGGDDDGGGALGVEEFQQKGERAGGAAATAGEDDGEARGADLREKLRGIVAQCPGTEVMVAARAAPGQAFDAEDGGGDAHGGGEGLEDGVVGVEDKGAERRGGAFGDAPGHTGRRAAQGKEEEVVGVHGRQPLRKARRRARREGW